MKVSDFDFDLPKELIAQEPPAMRGGSRLLVLDRETGVMAHRQFSALPEYLLAGDVLVLNNSRVIPARLLGHRVPSGGAVECLLLEPIESGTRLDSYDSGKSRTGFNSQSTQLWSCLVHPGQKLKPGARVLFERDGHRLHGEIIGRRAQGHATPPGRSHPPRPEVPFAEAHGRRIIRLEVEQGSVAEAVERIGHVPLPPYIARDDKADDRERYQTVYARHAGSVAAPTAGLHVTGALLDTVRSQGVDVVEVTLHVGYGTFKPVRVDDVASHQVDPEWFDVSESAAARLTTALRDRRRIIAVGTTTTRVLESLTIVDGRVLPARGETRAFIYPGHRFQLVSGLVSNFHLPRSSLLMLVAAFAGRERVLDAYRAAVAEGYRFYSYGDAMLAL